MTNPQAAGAEVAFKQSTGYAGLYLGAWGCPGGWPGGPLYEMAHGAWRDVAYFDQNSTTKFCLFTYNGNGSGSFSGDLNWD